MRIQYGSTWFDLTAVESEKGRFFSISDSFGSGLYLTDKALKSLIADMQKSLEFIKVNPRKSFEDDKDDKDSSESEDEKEDDNDGDSEDEPEKKLDSKEEPKPTTFLERIGWK